MSTPRERLDRLLGGEALAALRARLRRRYELGRSNDSFTLNALSADERRALEGLLGRRLRESSSMLVSVGELDNAFSRAGVAASLRNALEQLDGPIRELAAERMELRARWDTVFAQRTPTLLAALVGQNQGRGLIKRLAGGDPERGKMLLESAAKVIDALPAKGVPLSHLSAMVLGDSHALDEGRPVATLALAALRGTECDDRPRDIWATVGAFVSELAAPALAFNLPVVPGDPLSDIVRQSAAMGEPLHLSLRMLVRRAPRWDVEGRKVFACENPDVISIAADRLGRRCAPMVCTDGMPGAAQRTLLTQLAAAGAQLLYHGDFDWPGITIANFVMRGFGANPWRYATGDFRAESGFPLTGPPVAASWDSDLAPKMAAVGSGLHEEAVIEDLLLDLAQS